jgi:DNA repair exonuclease SbcCD ATPase subunit
MIPVRLKMRNFMCYREDVPPLSFDGIHTACLSGDNGNGKSALIDAMTWALWGQAIRRWRAGLPRHPQARPAQARRRRRTVAPRVSASRR